MATGEEDTVNLSEFVINLSTKFIGWLVDVLSKSSLLRPGIPARELKVRAHERRSGKDRRKSPIDQRLRTGLWLQYHRETRSGERDLITLNEHTRCKMHDALWPEIVKYEFRYAATGTGVPAKMVLDAALHSVWKHRASLPDSGREQQAVLVIEALASELVRQFQPACIDKRRTERRFQEVLRA